LNVPSHNSRIIRSDREAKYLVQGENWTRIASRVGEYEQRTRA
jgi:hypothetical protein